MVKTFLTNENNDLYIGNDGNLVIGSDKVAILAACKSATKAQLGEMVLQTDLGLPNFQLLWRGNPNIPQYEAALRKTLLSVAGVIGVKEVVLSVENNTLSYTATITTVSGEIVINE